MKSPSSAKKGHNPRFRSVLPTAFLLPSILPTRSSETVSPPDRALLKTVLRRISQRALIQTDAIPNRPHVEQPVTPYRVPLSVDATLSASATLSVEPTAAPSSTSYRSCPPAPRDHRPVIWTKEAGWRLDDVAHRVVLRTPWPCRDRCFCGLARLGPKPAERS